MASGSGRCVCRTHTLKSAAGDKIWTLLANMGTRITGKIMDPKDTLEILQLMAGKEMVSEVSGMVRQPGTFGSSWEDSDSLSLREHNKVSVEEVQKLQEGENITMFMGEVIRGSSLYISDVDKLSKEAIRINRFIEVAPPSVDELLATAPEKVRRSYPRVGRIQQIFFHFKTDPGRADLQNLVLIDPALAASNELEKEWQHIWRRIPGATVRSTLLWYTALGQIPTQGRGYRSQIDEAQSLAVGLKRLHAYSAQHVQAVKHEEKQHGHHY